MTYKYTPKPEPDPRNLISRVNFNNLSSRNQIEEQIEIRCGLIREMVGSLYPRILEDEIKELNELKIK